MQISTNCVTGKKVKSIDDLYELAIKHKAVYDVDLGLKPARVIMNQQAWKLRKKLLRGGVYTVINNANK